MASDSVEFGRARLNLLLERLVQIVQRRLGAPFAIDVERRSDASDDPSARVPDRRSDQEYENPAANIGKASCGAVAVSTVKAYNTTHDRATAID